MLRKAVKSFKTQDGALQTRQVSKGFFRRSTERSSVMSVDIVLFSYLSALFRRALLLYSANGSVTDSLLGAVIERVTVVFSV